MKKQLPRVAIYIFALLLILLTLRWLTSSRLETVCVEDGAADLSAFDLSSDLIRIDEKDWEYYPGVFYGPEDFEEGIISQPSPSGRMDAMEYGTYRLTLTLPQGELYAITGRGPNLSMRLYIDGELIGEIGSPGESREETLPRTKTYDYYFRSSGEKTEFIFQIAGFHHRDGGSNTPFVIAQPELVNHYRSLEFIMGSIFVGCIVTAALYFLGMFIFFPQRLQYLYLALAALVTAMRIPFTGEKHIMEVFPELNWFFSIKFEYIMLVLFVVFLMLYFDKLYPRMLPRWFTLSVITLSAAFVIIVLFTDSLFFSRVQQLYVIVWVSASIVTLWGLLRQLRHGGMHTFLIMSGFMVFFACALYDEIMYLFVDNVRLNNTLIVGVLICVFMNMIALTLDYFVKERELAESHVSVMLSQIQPHFLYNSLVVISQLCEIDPAEAKQTTVDFSNYLRGNLDSLSLRAPIPFEAELEHVKTYLSLEKKRFGDRVNVVYDLQCTDFLLPTLTLQPMVENAVRYGITQKPDGGTITIASEEDEGSYIITVTDDGQGFDTKAKSREPRSHIGIDNVRGRLSAMCGGRLYVDSTIGLGTKITIEIPKKDAQLPPHKRLFRRKHASRG